VFAPRRLRAIRNGSRLLKSADDEAGALVTRRGGEVFRALGGVVVAGFEGSHENEVHVFIRDARRCYQRKGIGVTVATHQADKSGDFYELVMGPLLRKLREQKDCPEQPFVTPPASPLAATCDVSGAGFAYGLVRPSAGANESWRVSEAEFGKWNLGNDDAERNLLPAGRGAPRCPDTAEDLVNWAGGIPDRQVAVVFADVNRLGALLPHLARQRDVYKKFAPGLARCLDEALSRAVKDRLLPDVGTGKTVPLKLLFLGGDDLCFMIAARFALPFVQRLFEEFQQKSQALLKGLYPDCAALPVHMTLSAGIAVAPYKYPIQAFRRLGQGLERTSKAAGYAWSALNNGAHPPSLVDFYVVRNDAAGHISELRAHLRPLIKGVPTALYGGPYLVAGDAARAASRRFLSVKRLLAASDKLAAFSARSKLKALVEVFSRDGLEHEYGLWLRRLDEAQTQTWKCALKLLELPVDSDGPPCAPDPRRNTPILDALDALEIRGRQR
jgi:hypothetical protein